MKNKEETSYKSFNEMQKDLFPNIWKENKNSEKQTSTGLVQSVLSTF